MTMESLYSTCTALGTAIFILIFLNYFLEGQADRNDEEKTKTPVTKKDKKENMNKSGKKKGDAKKH